MTEKSYEPLNNLSYKKSNELISGKFKSTLLENQITSIALTRIEAESDGTDIKLVARLYPGELKRLIGDPTHIYRTLKTVSKSITGHTMILEDGKGNFAAFPIIDDAEYKNGIFEIRFHERLKPHIFGLENKYTTLELSVMTSFKKSASFRIYELLKSHIYKSKPSENDGAVEVEYNLSELRFMIGLADVDDKSIVNERARMNDNIDWDVLFNKLPKDRRTYEVWAEFDRNVLKPAQKELQEISDIRFEYKGLREGRRIGKVFFRIYKNTPENIEGLNERADFIKKNAMKDRQLEIPMDLPKYSKLFEKYVGHNDLAEEDILLFIKKANGDEGLVEKAIKQADKEELLNNYIGWIIKCIERGGYDDVLVVEGDRERGKRLEQVMSDYENNKDEIVAGYWSRVKTREDFPQFIDYLQSVGEDYNMWDIAYTCEEKCQAFIQWRKDNKIFP